MARRRRSEEGGSMDSLLDALTNVVGILLLILITTSLGISNAVQKIVENLPDVTQEDVDQQRQRLQDKIDDLKTLQLTLDQQKNNEITEDEASQIVMQIDQIEEENSTLTDKLRDIEELRKKIEEQEGAKKVNEEEINVASTELANLRALLAQTPDREVKPPKEVRMPNPRLAPAEAVPMFIVCKYGKLYFVGDPYEHVFRVRDVIDQNFAKLAYREPAVGSYTYTLDTNKQNDAKTSYLPHTESVRKGDRFVKDLALEEVQFTEFSNDGSKVETKDMLSRLFGADDRKEFNISKFRLDEKKIAEFFGDGKLGPADFSYYVTRVGTSDRLSLKLGFKEKGGWPIERFTKANSEFHQACKRISVQRSAFFFFMVAPDSFETYLDARNITESYNIPAGWTTFTQDRFNPQAQQKQETTRVNLEAMVHPQEFVNIAKIVGPSMVITVKDSIENLDKDSASFVPKDMKDAAEKEKFVAAVKAARKDVIIKRLQPYTRQIYEATMAANEAKGEKEVRIDVHPPEIPHSRVFVATALPTQPPASPDGKKPVTGPPKNTTDAEGAGRMTLD